MSVVTFEKLRPIVLEETSDPDASDSGYKIGTLWLNTSSNRAFICIVNTSAAAIWIPLGGQYISLTAGANLTAPACVSLDSSGEIIYASATQGNAIGFIPVSITSGAVGLVQYAGKFTYTGASYASSAFGLFGYLSTTDGEVSETPPAFASGRTIKPVCIFLSSDEFLINMQPGRTY